MCIGGGFFVSSLLFYLRQMNLFVELAQLQKDRAEARAALEALTNRYSKFKGVASQILIPYPLDEVHLHPRHAGRDVFTATAC